MTASDIIVSCCTHRFRNAKNIFDQGAYLLWTSGPDVQKDVVPASEQNVCGNVINVEDIEAPLFDSHRKRTTKRK